MLKTRLFLSTQYAYQNQDPFRIFSIILLMFLIEKETPIHTLCLADMSSCFLGLEQFLGLYGSNAGHFKTRHLLEILHCGVGYLAEIAGAGAAEIAKIL